MEYLKAFYGLVGAPYPKLSLVVVCLLFAIVGGALWAATAHQYTKEQAERKPSSQAMDRSPQSTRASKDIPDAIEGAGTTSTEDDSMGRKNKNDQTRIEQRTSGPNSPAIVTTGPNSPVTVQPTPNPYVPVVWYDPNGAKHVQKGNVFSVENGELATFPRFVELEQQQNWGDLRVLAEEAIVRAPEWLTAYVFSGVAHAQLGHTAAAIEKLEVVERNGARDEAYSNALVLLADLRARRSK